jgi:large subunit ribosomal protein L13
VNTPSYKTAYVNSDTAKKEWFLVDAENQVVGRLATKVAMVLRGKTKPSYSPHVDCGDNVIIINAEKAKFTGNKTNDRVYTRYTGYPGGQRFSTPREKFETNPTWVLRHAIKGMLPKNKLGSKLQTNVFIYAGTSHPHEAQQPKKLTINNR